MTHAPTEKGRNAVELVVDVVIEMVRACGKDGVPGGHLYAMLMAPPLNLTYDSFEMLMFLATSRGKLEKRGQCYFMKEEKT